MRERAQIIVESERTHPGSHQYHKYMHFVRASDSRVTKQPDWEGITGRVKQLLELQDERVKQLLDMQEGRMRQLLASQDERSDNLMKAVERLDAKLASMDH